MRKKTAIVIMMVLAVSMLWGCGKKTVDYGLDGDTEQFVAERDDVDVQQDLAEMKVVEHWTDEWQFNSAVFSDDRVTLDTMKIDADVVMPDIDRFPIIEAEQIGGDALFRKKFVTTFLSGSEIREYEEEQYTKDEIKEIIEDLEEGAESDDPDVREMYEGFIREYEELLETAPEEAVEATDYANRNSYSGELADGLTCVVNFNETEEGFWIYAGPDPESPVFCPKSVHEYDRREQAGINENDAEMQNECKYTMAEAKRMADTFLTQIGLGTQTCTKIEEPLWRGTNLDENGDITEYTLVPYGYKFTYSTGIDGIALNRYADDMLYTDDPFDWQITGDRTEIVITDEGIIQVDAHLPITVHKVTYADELLPLEEIKEIMKKEALENTEKYLFVSEDNFSPIKSEEMGLYFVRVNDTEQEGVFYVRPLWCLTDSLQFHPIFVDAITGEVTYPFMEGVPVNGMLRIVK